VEDRKANIGNRAADDKERQLEDCHKELEIARRALEMVKEKERYTSCHGYEVNVIPQAVIDEVDRALRRTQ